VDAGKQSQVQQQQQQPHHQKEPHLQPTTEVDQGGQQDLSPRLNDGYNHQLRSRCVELEKQLEAEREQHRFTQVRARVAMPT
jgi:hypothetical protein